MILFFKTTIAIEFAFFIWIFWSIEIENSANNVRFLAVNVANNRNPLIQRRGENVCALGDGVNKQHTSKTSEKLK